MKKMILFLCFLLVAVMFFVFRGVERYSSLETYGTIKSKKMRLTVTLTREEPGLAVESMTSGFDLGFFKRGTWVTVRPSSWVNHSGFFVYIDDDGRCWAHNGLDRTFIYERTSSGGKAWEVDNFPGEIPEYVREKLSSKM